MFAIPDILVKQHVHTFNFFNTIYLNIELSKYLSAAVNPSIGTLIFFIALVCHLFYLNSNPQFLFALYLTYVFRNQQLSIGISDITAAEKAANILKLFLRWK